MWMIDDPFSFDYFFPFSSRRQFGPAFLDQRYQIILLYLPEDSNEQVIGLPRYMLPSSPVDHFSSSRTFNVLNTRPVLMLSLSLAPTLSPKRKRALR